jgi:hypothetical protein
MRTPEYRGIPQRVKESAIKLLPFYTFVKSALTNEDGIVWFNPDAVGNDFTKVAVLTESYSVAERLQDRGLTAGQTDSLSEDNDWIFVKNAGGGAPKLPKITPTPGRLPGGLIYSPAVSGTGEEFKAPISPATRPLLQISNLAPAPWNNVLGGFGTSPLFSMLTSGLLGGGLGYLSGTLAENLFPEDFLEKGKLRKTTAALGGLLGAAGPAYLGTVGHRNWEDPNRSAWNSWIEPNVFFGKQKTAIHKAYEKIAAQTKDSSIEEWLTKEAVGEYSGLMVSPSIPVDAFNRVVMEDPFASTPLQTATVGLTEAANQAKGNMGLISPMDIARIGLGMGAGLSQAYLGGKVLGALAGLTPKAQETLQQAGMFAGALKAVVPGLFGK